MCPLRFIGISSWSIIFHWPFLSGESIRYERSAKTDNNEGKKSNNKNDMTKSFGYIKWRQKKKKKKKAKKHTEFFFSLKKRYPNPSQD